jgi:hypothetical protein
MEVYPNIRNCVNEEAVEIIKKLMQHSCFLEAKQQL